MDRNFCLFVLDNRNIRVALRKESVDRNITTTTICIALKVALRKESVDRNLVAQVLAAGRAWSLSARRAWIEMAVLCLSSVLLLVALRKESVDRNTTTTTICIVSKVALRKESVDRNTSFPPAGLSDLPSLSARRAWIEICQSG